MSPGPGGPLEPDHVWSIIANQGPTGSTPPINAHTDAPLPSAAETRYERHRGQKEPTIKKAAAASLRGFPRPQRRTMGLTGVGGRQQDRGTSERTRTAPSVRADNAPKEPGTLRRARIYVLPFQSARLLTADTKGNPEEEKKKEILDSGTLLDRNVSSRLSSRVISF